MVLSSSHMDQSEVMQGALRRVLEPIETARGLPNPCYVDADAYDDEARRVFAGGWACAGFAMDAAEAGDLYPFAFAGMPLVMVRGRDGELRVFHNICRHRGRILVTEPGHVEKAMVCPYHSWTYDLAGGLVGAPHVGGLGRHACAGFEKGAIGLVPVRSAVWFGLVFVDLSGRAGPFDDYIRPVAERWSDFAGVPLVHAGADCTITFDLACNWKLAVENYCEAYHLPWVHPGLNKYSPLDRHTTIAEGAYAGQATECYDPAFPDGSPAFPNAPDLGPFWRQGAEYIALFPNLLLGIHRDHFYAVLIQPTGPARTRERFEIFYYDPAVRGADFETARAANRELWRTIFAEDRDAVESMQRGRASPAYDGGIFSPVMDTATHDFHRWIARALLQGRRPGAFPYRSPSSPSGFSSQRASGPSAATPATATKASPQAPGPVPPARSSTAPTSSGPRKPPA